MTPLELLDSVAIASPCPVSWDAMTGDDKARHCSTCDRQVYNIAALTTAEAAALIVAKEGKLCGRIFRRKDGTILTADCPVGHKTKRRRRLKRLALGGVLAALIVEGGTLLAGRVTWRRVLPNVPPAPSGPGVTLADWKDWALVALGLKTYPQVTFGVICMPDPPGGWESISAEDLDALPEDVPAAPPPTP